MADNNNNPLPVSLIEKLHFATQRGMYAMEKELFLVKKVPTF